MSRPPMNEIVRETDNPGRRKTRLRGALIATVASLGMLVWMSGQISLCQMAFAAIGAATAGHMLARGVPWLLAVLIGALVAIPAGAIVAIPAIRLAGTRIPTERFFGSCSLRGASCVAGRMKV